MTDWLDKDPDMGIADIDSATADRLLVGVVEPEDAPPGFGEVAALVRALTVEATTDELVGEEEAVAAIAAVVRARSHAEAPGTQAPPRRRIGRTRLRVAVAIALSLLVGTTALAAAGELPGRAQDVASDVFRKIGVSVPRSDEERTKPPAQPPRGGVGSESDTGVTGATKRGPTTNGRGGTAPSDGDGPTGSGSPLPGATDAEPGTSGSRPPEAGETGTTTVDEGITTPSPSQAPAQDQGEAPDPSANQGANQGPSQGQEPGETRGPDKPKDDKGDRGPPPNRPEDERGQDRDVEDETEDEAEEPRRPKPRRDRDQ